MLPMPRIVRPNPPALAGRSLVPPLDRQRVDPLSETKNCPESVVADRLRQIA
jgi:hypothetical protein